MISLFKKPEEPDENEPEHGDEPDDQERTDANADEENRPEAPAKPETELQAAKRELREALRETRIQLAQGSVWLSQWYKALLGEWCQAGRRDDLDGLSAVLGVWVRRGVLLALAWGTWKIVEAQPAVLLAIGWGWLVAAARAEHPEIRAEKRAARAAAKQREADTEVAAEAEDVEADDEGDVEPPVVALIRSEIGADSGVHLCDLYPAMRVSLPGCSQAPDEVLRNVLTAHHIPVRRSIRARGVAGRSGVHRSDLPPLPSPEGAPEALSTPLSTREDAGQNGSGERRGEQRRGTGRAPGSPKGGAARITQDPDNPVRWHVSHTP